MLSWPQVILVLVMVLAGLGFMILLLLRSEQISEGPGGVSVRYGSWTTISSLGVGIFISALAGMLVWRTTLYLTDEIIPWHNLKKDYVETVGYLQHATGIIVGALVGIFLIFLPGQFTILVGQRAYASFARVPLGLFGPGWGWVIPLVMKVVPVPFAATQNSDDGPVEYSTGDGLEIFLQTGATVSVQKPLLVQTLQADSINQYITDRRNAATRRYASTITLLTDVVGRAMTENASPEDQLALFTEIRMVKGEVSKNGPGTIQDFMNEELAEFGLYANQVEVENIRFNDQLEKRSQEIFDEIAQALSLRKDALNKNLGIKTFVEQGLKDLGINPKDLTQQEKLDLFRRASAIVLASEGQGSYNFHDFGTQPPVGVVINAKSGGSDVHTPTN